MRLSEIPIESNFFAVEPDEFDLEIHRASNGQQEERSRQDDVARLRRFKGRPKKIGVRPIPRQIAGEIRAKFGAAVTEGKRRGDYVYTLAIVLSVVVRKCKSDAPVRFGVDRLDSRGVSVEVGARDLPNCRAKVSLEKFAESVDIELPKPWRTGLPAAPGNSVIGLNNRTAVRTKCGGILRFGLTELGM
jgi:hypothetical protein